MLEMLKRHLARGGSGVSGHIASSGNVCWRTPDEILTPVREFFDGEIDLDPCAGETLIAEVNWRIPEKDGLTKQWRRKQGGRLTAYVNSPFGRYGWDPENGQCYAGKELTRLGAEDPGLFATLVMASISDWTGKCYIETESNPELVVVQLLPAAVDTKHWHEVIFRHANSVCFIKGRLKFVGASASAPMACALVQWGSFEHHSSTWFEECFSKTGECFAL